jgi:hypothetical protein
MLHAAGRIDDDEVVFVCSPNFLELRYELPQVSAVAPRTTVDEVVVMRSPNFLEPRHELPQVTAVASDRNLFRDRIVIGQLQFPLVLPTPFTPIPEVPREG